MELYVTSQNYLYNCHIDVYYKWNEVDRTLALDSFYIHILVQVNKYCSILYLVKLTLSSKSRACLVG